MGWTCERGVLPEKRHSRRANVENTADPTSRKAEVAWMVETLFRAFEKGWEVIEPSSTVARAVAEQLGEGERSLPIRREDSPVSLTPRSALHYS